MIIERAHGADGVGCVEGVFFSKVSGVKTLEMFEKSIDKHKIDAILDAPSSAAAFLEVSWCGRA